AFKQIQPSELGDARPLEFCGRQFRGAFLRRLRPLDQMQRQMNMNTPLVDNMLKLNTLNTPQDSITRIEHDEPLPQLQIALRQASPTVSRLPGAGAADSNPKSGNLTNTASNIGLVEALASSK